MTTRTKFRTNYVRILWRYRIGTKPSELNIRKKTNEVFVRCLLSTRKQRQDESIEDFFQSIERLRRICNFRDRTAKQVGDEAMRDAFICGITSTVIRQRLLGNKAFDLQTAYEQTLRLDLAQKNNEACVPPRPQFIPRSYWRQWTAWRLNIQ